MDNISPADIALTDACEAKGIRYVQSWTINLPQSASVGLGAYRLVTANDAYPVGHDFDTDIRDTPTIDQESDHIIKVTGCAPMEIGWTELKPAKLFANGGRPDDKIVWTATNASVGLLVVAGIWKAANISGGLQISELVWQL